MLLQMALFHSNGVIFFRVELLFHCIHVPLPLYSFICWWTLSCFRVLAVVGSAAVNIGVYVSFWITIFSKYMPRSGIARVYGSSVFRVFLFVFLLRKLHTLLHSGRTSLRSHQQHCGHYTSAGLLPWLLFVPPDCFHLSLTCFLLQEAGL